ncbi:hypothetical protein ACHAPQ_010933 [Fusarium lateritium]
MFSVDSATMVMKHKWVEFNGITYVGPCYLVTTTAVEPEWFSDLPFSQDDRLAVRSDGSLRQPRMKEAPDAAHARIWSQSN